MKALITGGAGFIGSTITRMLLEQGHEVRVLDSLVTGQRSNVPPGVEFVEGDVRSHRVVRQASAGVDVVLHQAAMVSVPRSITDPAYCFDVNIQGTRNVLRAASEGGCPRVVLASSAAIYGSEPTVPKREDMPQAAMSPYAYSKWINEVDAEFFSRYCGMETVCLRYFNVFGPGQRADSPYSGVISIATKAFLEDRVFTVFGTGEQTRDFIYVDDVAQAAVAAAVRPGIQNAVVNVGRGEPTSLLAMLQLLGSVLNCAPKLQFAPPRSGDVLHSFANTTQLATVLGVSPIVPLSEGLSNTTRWMTLLDTNENDGTRR